jgi:RNA polymerase sporulation-specific sigma factor
MYSDLSDNELLELINKEKNNDAMETLIKRFGPLVTRQSRSLYIIGADEEDLIQEGMIGLVKAVNDYKADKGASFKTFAFMCVRRQMLTAINNSNNRKNIPLNHYISIYGDGNGDYVSPLDEMDSGVITNPEDIMLARLQESDLIKVIESKLSKFEHQVLDEYLTGASYEEIGERLGKTAKSIDNAVQRIRAKLRDV